MCVGLYAFVCGVFVYVLNCVCSIVWICVCSIVCISIQKKQNIITWALVASGGRKTDRQ